MRLMEADGSAAPQRPARVQPEADGVHAFGVSPRSWRCRHSVWYSRRGEEQGHEQLRGSDEIDMLAAYSPFHQVLPTTTTLRPVSISLPPELPTTTNLRPVSISLPASPRAFQVARTRVDELQRRYATGHHPADRRIVFPSQPVPAQDKNDSALPPRMEEARTRGRNSYDSFKTWSGKLERQIAHATHLLGSSRPEQEEEETAGNHMPGVQRFFAALEGPELDTLRSSEELILLPSDKTWPFLLRFPVSAFGMVLGMSSQGVAISASTQFLHITVKTNLVLWCVSVALMLVVSALYACKLVLFFEAVRREYYHPIRANFFFAPWIACLFLAIGVPEAVAETLPRWLWYLLMAPILCLELKIYGQWISGGQRRLSRVANPSNHLSVVGNFVGAMLGGIMGLKEGPLLFFAVGLAHYMVLFVTLYQRLPTSETLPRDLHPVFFLFVATPSVACLAWARITGEFDYGSKIAYFIAMFLYASLAVRINLFRGFRFSLAWWAYTFPMTSAAIASIRYSSEVKNVFTQALCIGLWVAATLTVTALFFTTLLHAVVLRDLFPNDISIAITESRFKPAVVLRDLFPNDISIAITESRFKPGGVATEMMTTMPAERGGGSKAPSDAGDIEAAVATSYT